MRHLLVVANKTLGGEELLRVVKEKDEAEPTEVWLVVPATPLPASNPDAMVEWGTGVAIGPTGALVAEKDKAAWDAARDRLDYGLERLRRAGVTVGGGEVGSRDPARAVADALVHHQADEIIVSTMPSGVSHWLRLDLPKRLERKHHVPVTTVTMHHAHR